MLSLCAAITATLSCPHLQLPRSLNFRHRGMAPPAVTLHAAAHRAAFRLPSGVSDDAMRSIATAIRWVAYRSRCSRCRRFCIYRLGLIAHTSILSYFSLRLGSIAFDVGQRFHAKTHVEIQFWFACTRANHLDGTPRRHLICATRMGQFACKLTGGRQAMAVKTVSQPPSLMENLRALPSANTQNPTAPAQRPASIFRAVERS